MLAITGAQTKALRLSALLKEINVKCSVISTPRKYAKEGCSYSVKFDSNDIDKVISVCRKAGMYTDFV